MAANLKLKYPILHEAPKHKCTTYTKTVKILHLYLNFQGETI